jgi:hypothetical protein
MKIAIIALLISLAALGLGSFATARTFNESHPAPPESQWSEAECVAAKEAVFGGLTPQGELYSGTLEFGCRRGDCGSYADMLQAINDNCP